MDDDELIAAVAAGDDTALRELFTRHAPWLAARLRGKLPAADVEDVLQETFLAVWRGAAGYRPGGAAGGWLWGIARRQAALLLRRRGPAVLSSEALFPDALSPEALAPGALAARAPACDPAEAALARADLDRALAALGSPGAPDREVWRLLYEEDRPAAEVARRLGIPVGTVKSRAFRVRRRLRAALRGGQAAEARPRVETGPKAEGGPR